MIKQAKSVNAPLHQTFHPKTSQTQLTCCRASASLALCLPLMCLSTKSLATNILVLSVLPHLQRQLGTPSTSLTSPVLASHTCSSNSPPAHTAKLHKEENAAAWSPTDCTHMP